MSGEEWAYWQSVLHCCTSSSQACLAVGDSATVLHSLYSVSQVAAHSSSANTADEKSTTSDAAMSWRIFMMLPSGGWCLSVVRILIGGDLLHGDSIALCAILFQFVEIAVHAATETIHAAQGFLLIS